MCRKVGAFIVNKNVSRASLNLNKVTYTYNIKMVWVLRTFCTYRTNPFRILYRYEWTLSIVIFDVRNLISSFQRMNLFLRCKTDRYVAHIISMISTSRFICCYTCTRTSHINAHCSMLRPQVHSMYTQANLNFIYYENGWTNETINASQTWIVQCRMHINR